MREGWGTAALGSVCEVLDRKRKPITKKDRIAGPYPYYGATGVLDHVDGWLFDEPLVLVGEDGAKWRAGERTAFHVSGKCWVNNHAHVLRPDRAQLIDAWLVYFLNYTDLSSFVSGLTVPKLNQGMMREIPLPLPPLSEQERIVAILDEAFEALATATANTEKNLINVRALIEAAPRSIFHAHDQEGWRDSLVTGLAADRRGAMRTGPFGSQLLKREIVDEGIAVLGIDSAVQNHFSEGRRRFITEGKFEELKRFEAFPGDVVITIMGTCGRCAVLPPDLSKSITSKHLCCITLDTSRCLPEYLRLYFLSHPVAKDHLAKHAKGAVMDGLNMSIIKSLPVRFPTLDVQRAIVDSAEDVDCEIARLTSLGRSKAEKLKCLKQSILQRAFSGELTAVDRELSDAGL